MRSFSSVGTATMRWAAELLTHKHYKVVAVALANKMARILWAPIAKGQRFEATRTL